LSQYALESIPIDYYNEIFDFTVDNIRKGSSSPEICQMLYTNYGIGNMLMSYFVNEGLSEVRLTSLSPSDINLIGHAYLNAAKRLAENGKGQSEIECELKIDTTQDKAEFISPENIVTDELE